MLRSLSSQVDRNELGHLALCFAAGAGGLLLPTPVTHELGAKALVEGVLGSVKTAPRFWEYISDYLPRRRLKFLLSSRELAANVLGAEDKCYAVWGRRFSEFERVYLTELQQLNPLYGI